MYYELTKKEIQKFIKKYLNEYDDYTNKIRHISVIEFNKIKEYRINKKYTLRVYK